MTKSSDFYGQFSQIEAITKLNGQSFHVRFSVSLSLSSFYLIEQQIFQNFTIRLVFFKISKFNSIESSSIRQPKNKRCNIRIYCNPMRSRPLQSQSICWYEKFLILRGTGESKASVFVVTNRLPIGWQQKRRAEQRAGQNDVLQRYYVPTPVCISFVGH